MSHKWTEKQGQEEVDAILASTDNAETQTQIAKAFRRVIYMVEPENRIAIIESILTKFNPKALRGERKYDFPEPWTEAHWVKKVDQSYDGTMDTLGEILVICDTAKEVAEMLLKYIDDMNDDNQVFFLVCTLYNSGLCPYNFVSPNIRLDYLERIEISTRDHVAEALAKLDELFAGTIRTRSPTAEGAFLYEMLMKLSHKECVVVLGKYAKKARGKSKTKIIGIGFEVVRSKKGHDPKCPCGNCANTRASGGN